MTGSIVDPPGELKNIAATARALIGESEQNIVVTLGAKGVIAVFDGLDVALQGHKVNVVDTTGAGDCFVGAFVAQLANGVHFEQALTFANAAAAVSVQRRGAGPSMPTSGETRALLSAN